MEGQRRGVESTAPEYGEGAWVREHGYMRGFHVHFSRSHGMEMKMKNRKERNKNGKEKPFLDTDAP